MRILKPNVGQEFVPIAMHHTYVKAEDTKQVFFLKEIKIGLAHHTWEWISFRPDKFVDLAGINGNFCTFDNAINRGVNNPYCTIYEFENHAEMIINWDDIKYVDNITTVYKSEEK